MPSLDFIESAKFKYEENDYNLSPFKDFKDEAVIAMSATSIAQVCGTTKLRVLDILKDIFVKIIDSAKNGEQVALDIKIGVLKVDSENKLYFENNQDIPADYNYDLYDTHKTVEHGDNIERLSRGPKSVYSHASNMSTIRSVKTPMTIGKTSVKSQVRSSKWSFFKGSNNKELDAMSRRSKNSSIRSERRRLLNTTTRKEGLNKSEIVPTYPHLNDFIK